MRRVCSSLAPQRKSRFTLTKTPAREQRLSEPAKFSICSSNEAWPAQRCSGPKRGLGLIIVSTPWKAESIPTGTCRFASNSSTRSKISRTLLPLLRDLVTDGLIEAQDTVILQAAVGTGNEELMAVAGGAHCIRRHLVSRLWRKNPPIVSLEQAQQIALRNHPRIASAELAAQASGFAVKEARSAYYPTSIRQCHGRRDRARFRAVGGRGDHLQHL